MKERETSVCGRETHTRVRVGERDTHVWQTYRSHISCVYVWERETHTRHKCAAEIHVRIRREQPMLYIHILCV